MNFEEITDVGEKYKLMIVNLINDCFRARQMMSIDEYIRAIETLNISTISFRKNDNIFNKKFTIAKNGIDSEMQRRSPDQKKIITFYDKWLEALIELIGRSGFLPVKIVDGIIVDDDLNDDIQQQNKRN